MEGINGIFTRNGALLTPPLIFRIINDAILIIMRELERGGGGGSYSNKKDNVLKF
jgi:hypothetical protein